MQKRIYLRQTLILFFFCALTPLIMARSNVNTSEEMEKIRTYSRAQEFDYADWEIGALWRKLTFTVLGLPKHLSTQEGREMIDTTLALNYQIRFLEWQIDLIYSDPQITDPDKESEELKTQLSLLQEDYHFRTGVTETLLQAQINQGLADENIALLGQAFPPVLYHFSPLPKALIVSPRSVIQQDANISLNPEISFDELISLEDGVAKGLNVSTLITDVGGVGTYPSMVFQTSDLDWLLSTVAHEWTHNYLTLHPLGINYGTSGETRTMNETTAEIVGEKIKLKVLESYYPERLPPEENEQPKENDATEEPVEEQPVFDFAYEMYVTRRETDILLAEGKIDEAEAYMESRREFFWENGYQIRKLNQAYFAFHAAYVNAPSTGEEGQTGAAGQDPVGPAVWQLYEQSENLSEFLRTIAWIISFEDLQDHLSQP